MITIKGDVDLNPDAVLNLKGTINNSGSIDAGGSGTLIVQPSGSNSIVTLKGSGTINIGDHAAQITGGGSAVTFDNVNNKINGGGKIGGAGLTLKNEIGGAIDANDGTLIIDTGANTITNAGSLNAGAGTLVIASNLSNTGKLNADNGIVYVAGKATGGTAIISGLGSAALEFGAAASTATKFAVGTTGQLILADSAEYTGVISGFGANTTQSIDLADFNFTGAHATSFSLGVLTLKNTAGQVVHLHFSGTHTLVSFLLSDDGNFNGSDDGTKIVDPPPPTKPQSPLSNPLASLFAQFMASWSPITALSSEVQSPLASEWHMATNLLHAHG
jgi:large repetitive protein